MDGGKPFSHFSLEVMSQIFDLVPVWKVLQLECLSKKFQTAVLMSLKLRKRIDFLVENSNDPFLYMTDVMFGCLLYKIPNVMCIYNLSPAIFNRESIYGDTLSLEGVVSSLALMPMLAEITTNTMSLLEAVSTRMPKLHVNSCRRNSKRQFPPDPNQPTYNLGQMCTEKASNVTQIHFVKCYVWKLPPLPRQIKYISLKMVKFLSGNPFEHFDAPLLETFGMSHCVGPLASWMYLELLHTLSRCHKLRVLEMACVPSQEGMWRSVCFDTTWCALESLSLGRCWSLGLQDLLYLIRASRASLRTLRLHQSIPNDALMDYLTLKTNETGHTMPLRHLNLGWQDTAIDINHNDLVAAGVVMGTFDNRCLLTDIGMRKTAQNFPYLETLELADCPYLVNPVLWHSSPECMELSCLRELTVNNCSSVDMPMLSEFLATLPCLESLSLQKIGPDIYMGLTKEDILSHIYTTNYMLFPESDSDTESEDDSEDDAEVDYEDDSEGVTICDVLDDAEYDSQTDPDYPDFEVNVAAEENTNAIVKSLRSWPKSRLSSDSVDKNKVVPGETRPCSSRPGRKGQQPRRSMPKTSWRKCPVHKKRCNIGKCSCIDRLLKSRHADMTLEHSCLTRLYLDHVDVTKVDIVCPKMRTVSVTNCNRLKMLRFTMARDLVGVDVSGCPRLDEDELLSSLSRKPMPCSRIVSLQPMHEVINREHYSRAHMSLQHGSLFVFYHGKYDTRARIAPRVMFSFLEYFTKAAAAKAEYKCHQKKKTQKKVIYQTYGNGRLIYDVPWLDMLHEYMYQEQNTRLQDPSALQVPVGVMLRDHEEFLDELRQEIEVDGIKNPELYQHNVITYVNMCDMY